MGVWVCEVGADDVFAATCSVEIDVGKDDPNCSVPVLFFLQILNPDILLTIVSLG